MRLPLQQPDVELEDRQVLEFDVELLPEGASRPIRLRFRERASGAAERGSAAVKRRAGRPRVTAGGGRVKARPRH